MGKGAKWYSEEFKNTIVELYNSGKTLSELSSEYDVAKSTISGWCYAANCFTLEMSN